MLPFLEGLQGRFNSALGSVAAGKNVQKNSTDFGAKYSIENDGKYLYVKADRQVISSNIPDVWAKQVPDYINQKIRNNEDVISPTTDGHFLLLTARSAYKLTDRHVSAIESKIKSLLSDEKFALKLEAASHIDELIKAAKFRKHRADEGNKHNNDIREDGFNYFDAFFMDKNRKVLFNPVFICSKWKRRNGIQYREHKRKETSHRYRLFRH